MFDGLCYNKTINSASLNVNLGDITVRYVLFFPIKNQPSVETGISEIRTAANYPYTLLSIISARSFKEFVC